MQRYKVRFVEYGVEFTTEPMMLELADTLVKRLHDKGLMTAYKVEISNQF